MMYDLTQQLNGLSGMLTNFASTDGKGFTDYGKGNSTILLSAYALVALTDANKAVPGLIQKSVLDNLRNFLLS
jgi:hypothetical protein